MEQIINESSSNSECLGNREEDVFVQVICEKIVEAINISYKDRTVVVSLLKNVLSSKLDSRRRNEGLLQQYESYVLNKSSEKLIKELNLGDVNINHDYNTHAKFNDIIARIKELYFIDKK